MYSEKSVAHTTTSVQTGSNAVCNLVPIVCFKVGLLVARLPLVCRYGASRGIIIDWLRSSSIMAAHWRRRPPHAVAGACGVVQTVQCSSPPPAKHCVTFVSSGRNLTSVSQVIRLIDQSTCVARPRPEVIRSLIAQSLFKQFASTPLVWLHSKSKYFSRNSWPRTRIMNLLNRKQTVAHEHFTRNIMFTISGHWILHPTFLKGYYWMIYHCSYNYACCTFFIMSTCDCVYCN